MAIQEAILPFKGKMDFLLDEYFVTYKPKDVVSGDFYWIQQVQNKIILAVADCTGHGVPGAFMTLIGRVLLDKIIRAEHIYLPSEILARLDIEVMNVLKQKYTKNNTNGMDLAIITLEKQENEQTKIVFSGAKNNLLILEGDTLEEIKGVRRSIGGEQNTQIAFMDIERIVRKGGIIYAGSDGLVDQNDKKRRPIGSAKLKKFILQNASLSLNQQQSALESLLLKQLEGTTQRDDILFMGIRV